MFAALPSYSVNLRKVDTTGVVSRVGVGDASGQFDIRERLTKITFLIQLAAFLGTSGEPHAVEFELCSYSLLLRDMKCFSPA